ncbi:MAG: LytTR family DNA-binding domain-containing protein [Burkholderiaceae bacterium]|nr:LytTR family DNA-binding domain-containing protein [Burkholderiaceae bacterium]
MNASPPLAGKRPTALIAEDEPLLAQALQAELAHAWPELQIVASVGDGASAVTQALALKPDVLFFDIRMPGLSGLEAAAELADAWEGEAFGKAFPALVFVTAYDQYAVQAFEAQAVDYLLKPVQPRRLQKTVAKLQSAVTNKAMTAIESVAHLDQTVNQLRHLLDAGSSTATAHAHANTTAPLRVIQASVPNAQGSAIRMVPVDEVLYFEAADKYVRVICGKAADREYLIRTPLKELLPQLDRQIFWQIHRATVVRATAIDTVSRDESGKLSLTLRGCPDKIAVSRLYSYLFRAM